MTLAEVEQAVHALGAAARPVTTRNVRQALGDRGSLTTLATHLRVVRAKQAEQDAEGETRPGLALPDPLIEGLMHGAQRYWADINDAAEAVVAKGLTEAQQLVDAAREAERQARIAEEAARAAQASTAETLAETERALEALRAAHTTLVEEHRGLNVALGLAQEHGRGAEALATERKVAIAQRDTMLGRAERELGESRDAVERHCTEAAAREHELRECIATAEHAYREAQAAAVQLRVRLGQVEAALKQVSGAREEANGKCEESRKMLDAERSAHARTESALAIFKERCDGLGQALERSERHGRTIAAALERAEERTVRADEALEAQARAAARIESVTAQRDDDC